MPTCSFCKKSYKEPKGLTIFTFDGRSIHFCSSKCRKNANLERDPKKVNWIKKSGIKAPLEKVTLESKEEVLESEWIIV